MKRVQEPSDFLAHMDRCVMSQVLEQDGEGAECDVLGRQAQGEE